MEPYHIGCKSATTIVLLYSFIYFLLSGLLMDDASVFFPESRDLVSLYSKGAINVREVTYES